ncbi:interferon-induced 35 kDa protein [Embiotoca jacksoni]|uniref:interferon-induced 35 kDa protein n=1 Tax=Embiotoca jacksoni TaxID=100190 RepID=UPI003703FD76
MSSDEDFSLVPNPGNTLEGIKAQINKYKKQHEQLLEEQRELTDSRDNRREITEQCRQRRDTIEQNLKADRQSHRDQIANEKLNVDVLKQDERDLMKEVQKTQAAVEEGKAQNQELTGQTDVFAAVPDRKLVFTGLTGNTFDRRTFDMKPHVVYPMEGGTALVTFEEEHVAKNILFLKNHQVDLGGECSITVEARPVFLMLPRVVEIDTEVCPQRILISNLPKMNTVALQNLEIHFSKTKNGGGEVDTCEMLSDSGTVVITFVKTGFVEGLAKTQFHKVMLYKAPHRVRVTPFLNGHITNLKAQMTPCPRTVLLTGIPAIMERETLQDHMEIHFQKNGNGGGEIDAILYNPLGQHISAMFGGASSENKEDSG